MKGAAKNIVLFLAFCLIVLPLSGCIPPWIANERPGAFPGSIWESEDGLVRFEVSLDPIEGTMWPGTIKKKDTQAEMYFHMHATAQQLSGMARDEYLAAEPNERYGEKYIDWIAPSSESYECYEIIKLQGSENYFIAKVEVSTIYEAGEVITFYRVDENKDIQVKDFSVVDYETKIEKYPSDLVLEPTEDIGTALSQGTAALNEEYGESSGKIEIYYNSLNSCWLVKRNPSWWFGSSYYIIFQTDGDVLAIWEESFFTKLTERFLDD